MTLLAGRWFWWNQNSDQSFDLPKMVRRAKDARAEGGIIKYGFPLVEQAFTAAGIPFAVERYVYPSQPEAEAAMLANAVDAGAVAAVINAEVEWEGMGYQGATEGGLAMLELIQAFRARHPTVELYASVDTRGNRMDLPFMRVLAQHIAGWLPEVYPLAFRPGRPEGFVARAFADCLDGKDFGGIPVLPTIQTYDGIGARAVAEQIAEVKRRAHVGCQAYTIAHATDEEWAEFARQEEAPVMAKTTEQYADEIITILQALKAEPVELNRVLRAIHAAQQAVVLVAQAMADYAKST
jgi:hypothetical protein